MSLYNVREKFKYTLPTSSVEYVKNYNFSADTSTTVPIIIENIDSGSGALPITVNISVSDPWVSVINPSTQRSLIYPVGNVVLQPSGSISSSKTISVTFNLPPDIDVLPSASLEPRIHFDLLSGSFPINAEDIGGSSGPPLRNIIVAPDFIDMYINDMQTIIVYAYDNDGNVQSDIALEWTVSNSNIIQVVNEASPLPADVITYKIIKGVGIGTATLTIRDNIGGKSANILITVSQQLGASPQTPPGSGPTGGSSSSPPPDEPEVESTTPSNSPTPTSAPTNQSPIEPE